ncbi:hypothetical protein L218DRAFT_984691 [Marasmius fiardii PR-910]|nr:hypothetical protein L218DRAFT_984691 [Marasmius fiardii PR-910]
MAATSQVSYPENSNEQDTQQTVTDPITHRPVVVHDRTDIELERIPPSHVAKEQDREAQEQADALERAVDEELHKGWWPDASGTERRLRTQAALTAGISAGCGGFVSLSLSRFLSWSFGARSGAIWVDLLIGSLGSVILALGTGGVVFYYGQDTRPQKVEEKQDQKSTRWSKKSPQKHPETAAWLNSVLDTLWPIVNPALFTPLSDMLEDALQATLPKLIHGVRVADLGQGSESVRIIGMRWLDGGDSDVDEGDFVNLEVAVSYRSHSKATPNDQSGCIHLLTQFWLPGGMVLPVWVDITGLLATARLKLQLTPNPPFLSMMTLTLLGKPKITTSVTPLAKHFMDVMDIPGLSSWVQSAIDTAIEGYVAPRSLTLDLKAILSGREKMETDAIGVLVVSVIRAEGLKAGDSSKIWKTEAGRHGDPYVTVGWGKWGKPVWSTRVIQNEGEPVWAETNFMLISPAEVNAQETLRIQLWDSDRLTADDLLGKVEVPLQDLVRSPETKNHINERSDELLGDDGSKWPGQLVWSVGYYAKTTLEQHLSDKDADPKEIEEKVKADARRKLREAEARNHEDNPEIQEQTQEDLKEKTQEIMATSPPPAGWDSGILSILIDQITGVEVPNVRQTGVDSDMEQEESESLPNPYCTIVINHERVYQTRTKMRSNNPYPADNHQYNACTERFIKNWNETVVTIAVRDARLHENDPLIGVVVLPLEKILKERCQVTDSFPLVGGMGFGRLKCSLLFRSLQAKLSRPILGWDVGTLEIYPETIRPLEGLPTELTACRILLRTLYGKGKVYAKEDSAGGGGWRSKRDRPIRLAVKKRFASCLLIQFRKRVLGPDTTPAFGTFWLRDVPDNEDSRIKMVIRNNKGNAMERSRFNATEEIGDKLGELEMKVRFWPGLSSHHRRLSRKDAGIADVMEVLRAVEDDTHGIQRFDGQDDDDSSSSSSSSSRGSESESENDDESKTKRGGRLRGVKEGLADYDDRKEELHQKHRGVMQWGAVRKVAWIGKEAESTANEVTQGIKSRLKHQQRDGGIEKEV